MISWYLFAAFLCLIVSFVFAYIAMLRFSDHEQEDADEGLLDNLSWYDKVYKHYTATVRNSLFHARVAVVFFIASCSLTLVHVCLYIGTLQPYKNRIDEMPVTFFNQTQ